MCLFTCSFLNLLQASHKYEPKTDKTSQESPLDPPLSHGKNHHLVNLFLDDNSAYFFPAFLLLMQRKSYPHGRQFWTGRGEKTEKSAVGKRNKTDIGEHNGKAWKKSRTNTTNKIRDGLMSSWGWSLCFRVLAHLFIFAGVYETLVVCSHFYTKKKNTKTHGNKSHLPPYPRQAVFSEFPFTAMYGQWHFKNTDSDR